MAKQPSQYNSFLGGEVSPLLWHRADMSQFGKWFANAENIRFTTMGAFENRPGFVRVGPVLDHQLKPVVKLIPFVFNNEEVFEIEFITGKFRVRKHGEVIIREDGSEVVYDSPIKIESLQQLKYAQSGDIIFIASGTSPVMELRRLKTDGTEWQLTQIASDLMPLSDENDNEDNKVSISKVDFNSLPNFSTVSFQIYDPLYKYNTEPGGGVTLSRRFIFPKIEITFTFTENNEKYTRVFSETNFYTILNDLYNDTRINEILRFTITEEYRTGVRDNKYPQKGYMILQISTTSGREGEIASIEIKTQQSEVQTENLTFTPIGTANAEAIIYNNKEGYLPFFARLKYVNVNDYVFYGDELANPITFNDCVSLLQNPNYEYPKIELKKDGEAISFNIESFSPFGIILRVGYIKKYTKAFKHNFSPLSRKYQNYLVSFTEDVNLQEGTTFGIENKVSAGEIVTTQRTIELWTSEEILGKNKWRYYTSGNWKGTIKIYYSDDNRVTWKTLRTTISNKTTDPGIFNENTSGTIDTDNTLLYKIEASVTEGEVNINFFTDSFDVNSYYKILFVSGPRTYYAACIKNDVGEVLEKKNWRLPSFYDEVGYPSSIGFYQNRLFLARGYELWGSKINDFWDFYEPIELKKDDPINMSILTYKVNTIKNILTTKSFFIFTTGGEFGIASQGAISQDDKFLKQFSSHGSNDCTPLIVGNIVLFVDATGNTVRAFQYSFEADNYEATDISLFIEQKLKGKQIITAEYIRSTKECLFLDADGIIWVFKYMPEQNIMSWSHWKHGRYKITNICVTPNGAYDELYVVVDAPNGKFIERLDSSVYSDSVETYVFEEEVEEVQTQLQEGTVVNIDDSINNKYKATVDEFGKVKLRSPSNYVKIGLSYTSTGTLLTPTIQLQDQTYTTYNKMKPFKVHFRYRDSFGFKVGVEEEEKMEIDFTEPYMDIESATALTSGKKSVLIPSKYDGSGRVSFVQDEPYPMLVENVYLEVDYGGK